MTKKWTNLVRWTENDLSETYLISKHIRKLKKDGISSTILFEHLTRISLAAFFDDHLGETQRTPKITRRKLEEAEKNRPRDFLQRIRRVAEDIDTYSRDSDFDPHMFLTPPRQYDEKHKSTLSERVVAWKKEAPRDEIFRSLIALPGLLGLYGDFFGQCLKTRAEIRSARRQAKWDNPLYRSVVKLRNYVQSASTTGRIHDVELAALCTEVMKFTNSSRQFTAANLRQISHRYATKIRLHPNLYD